MGWSLALNQTATSVQWGKKEGKGKTSSQKIRAVIPSHTHTHTGTRVHTHVDMHAWCTCSHNPDQRLLLMVDLQGL
jgi:hypothetical protein